MAVASIPLDLVLVAHNKEVMVRAIHGERWAAVHCTLYIQTPLIKDSDDHAALFLHNCIQQKYHRPRRSDLRELIFQFSDYLFSTRPPEFRMVGRCKAAKMKYYVTLVRQ